MSKFQNLARVTASVTVLLGAVSLFALAGGSVAVESYHVDGNAVVVLVHNAGSSTVMVSDVAVTASLASGAVEASMSLPFTVAPGESTAVRVEFSGQVAESGSPVLGHSDEPGPWS